MARTAVADGAVATPFDLYHVTEVTAATAVPAGEMRSVGAPAPDEWEYLAEGYAWVLDACD